MRKIIMIIESHFLCRKTQRLVPLHTYFFPVLIPFHFGSRRDEILHLHLLKLLHAENKLTRNVFISGCFTYLSASGWYFFTSCFLIILEYNKYSLRCLSIYTTSET